MRSAVSHDDGRSVNASRQWTWAASIRPNSVPSASVAVATSSSGGATARPVTSPAPSADCASEDAPDAAAAADAGRRTAVRVPSMNWR